MKLDWVLEFIFVLVNTYGYMEDKNQNSVSNESSSQPVNPSPVNLSSSESNAANVQTQQVEHFRKILISPNLLFQVLDQLIP